MRFVLMFSPTFVALQVSFSTNHVPAEKPVWTTVTVNILNAIARHGMSIYKMSIYKMSIYFISCVQTGKLI
jgi:hypothetical protein